MAVDLEKRIKEVFAAYEAKNVDKILSTVADNVTLEDVALGTVSHGKEEVGANLRLLFAAFPDLKLSMTSYLASGDRECIEYVMSGTHSAAYMGLPATGKSISVRGVAVADLIEGKARRISQYVDSAAFMRQLGVLPPTLQK